MENTVLTAEWLSGAFLFFFDSSDHQINCGEENFTMSFLLKVREIHERQTVDHMFWLNNYNDLVFFQLFRMKRETFELLLNKIKLRDKIGIIYKIYPGGRHPVLPEKALLVFIRYIASQETLHSIADRFDLVPATVMHIVNAYLYILINLKEKYICWPKTEEEFEYLSARFTNYPDTIGAIDGTHIDLKVSAAQHDSYIDRYQKHSINLMAICTSDKIFTYIFVGYPGSAHDSRVFSNSLLVHNIEEFGSDMYFPHQKHIIGDAAFPLRKWLLTPYSRIALTRKQQYHNKKLSADRVCIENTFAILKLRWARLRFINSYSIAKAIEITTAACVLHNFCYLKQDPWEDQLDEVENNDNSEDNYALGNFRELQVFAEMKRNDIAERLWNERFN